MVPAPELIARLERIGLAERAVLARCAPTIGRCRSDLPPDDSLWIDVLTLRGALTPWQARQLHAGRDEDVRCGAYVLCEPLAWPRGCPAFRARALCDGGARLLLVVERPTTAIRAAIENLLRTSAKIAAHPSIVSLTAIEEIDGRLILTAPMSEGVSLAQWITRHGPLPPGVALAVLAQLAEALAVLQQAGSCHGGLCLEAVSLHGDGGVTLLLPAVETIFGPLRDSLFARPAPPFDGRRPEAIALDEGFSPADDLYAFGCLARSITGTADDDASPLASRARDDVESIVAECTARDPRRRPSDFRSIRARMGDVSPTHRVELAACLRRGGGPQRLLADVPPGARRNAMRVAAASVFILGAAALLFALRPWNAPLPSWLRSPPKQAKPLALVAANGLRRANDARGETHVPVERERPAPPPSPDSPGPPRSAGMSPPTADAGRATVEGDEALVASEEELFALVSQVRSATHIAPRGSGRLLIHCPADGLKIAYAGTRIERFDFHWSAATTKPGALPAMLSLAAERAEIADCSFVGPASGALQPVAIAWRSVGASGEEGLHTGRLQIERCRFVGVRSAVAHAAAGACFVDMTNVLHLGPGPLCWMNRLPASDEPLRLRLAHVTLRRCGPLVEFAAAPAPRAVGGIEITAVHSVFAPAADEPLIALGGDDADRFLRQTVWTGEGCLLAPATPVAVVPVQRDGRARREPFDESRLSISGVVRSAVRFADERSESASHEPAAADRPAGSENLATADVSPDDCAAVEWQAPLPSAATPGIEPHAVP